MFKIINAANTPGIQPIMVRIKTITIEPQPWSYTASGGNKIENITRIKLMGAKIVNVFLQFQR
ncbi:MAG: hypothetical protein WD334_07815 [Chitinophagales bacterium]